MDVDRGRDLGKIGGGSTGKGLGDGRGRTGDGSSKRVESGRNTGKLPSTA